MDVEKLVLDNLVFNPRLSQMSQMSPRYYNHNNPTTKYNVTASSNQVIKLKSCTISDRSECCKRIEKKEGFPFKFQSSFLSQKVIV